MVENMSVEDTKDSVDSYEGHDEQGHSNVSVVEEGNITETNLFQWNLFSFCDVKWGTYIQRCQSRQE